MNNNQEPQAAGELRDCPECDGMGDHRSCHWQSCRTCNGTGRAADHKQAACDREFSGATTAKVINGVACCPSCEQPLSDHKQRQTVEAENEFSDKLWKALMEVAGAPVCRMIEGWHNEAIAQAVQAQADKDDAAFERVHRKDSAPPYPGTAYEEGVRHGYNNAIDEATTAWRQYRSGQEGEGK